MTTIRDMGPPGNDGCSSGNCRELRLERRKGCGELPVTVPEIEREKCQPDSETEDDGERDRRAKDVRDRRDQQAEKRRIDGDDEDHGAPQHLARTPFRCEEIVGLL